MQRSLSAYLFSFQGRSGRLGYLGANLFWLPVSLVVGIIGGVLSAMAPVLGMVGSGLMVLLYVATVVTSFASGVRRLHDIGVTGWLALFPVVLLLACVPVFSSNMQSMDRVMQATQQAQALEASGDTAAAEQAMQSAMGDMVTSSPLVNPFVLAALGLIMVYGLVLLFWPGRPEDNAYGPNVPLKQG